MNERFRTPGTVLAVAAAVLLAGCGSSSGADTTSPSANGEDTRTATQAFGDAVSALRGAHTMHIKGHLKGSDGGDTSVDFHSDNQGNLEGQIAVGGLVADVIITGGHTYIHGQTYLAKVNPAVGEAVGDNWVVLPQSGDPVTALTSLATPQDLANVLKAGGDTVTRGALTTVDGKRALTLHLGDGDVAIALDGKPYPLQFSQHDSSDVITLSDFDAKLTVSAPNDPVDLSQATTPAPGD